MALVSNILPDYLANKISIAPTNSLNYSILQLSEQLNKSLEESIRFYRYITPIRSIHSID